MSELELKFEVPAGVVAALRAELGRRGGRSSPLTAYYYDTPDFTLARHGVSLRLRREGRSWVQTLKAEGSSAIHRLEHNVSIRGASGVPPRLDLHRHKSGEAGAALRNALGKSEAKTLGVRYSTRITRFACDLRIGNSVIEAAFDRGTIKAESRSEVVCELELEHKSGPTRALFDLAKAWSAYAGLWLSTRSKAERGVALAEVRSHRPATKARKPRVDDDMTGTRFLRAVLRSTLDQVLANASEIASSGNQTVDEEHVHQCRVGLRRLRTALRELGPLDYRVDPQWERPLSEAFTLLGEARDKVTAARAVQPLLELTQAPLTQWQNDAEVDPVAAVRAVEFQSALLDLLGFALEEDDGGPLQRAPAPAQLRADLHARLAKLHAKVCAAGERFERLPFEQQHKTRKRLKRLRYLAEFVEPLSKDKAAKRYLAHLEPAQDAIGRHMDIAVAMQRFSKDAQLDPRALFAARYLEAYLGNTARIAHVSLRAMAAADPFWT